MTFWSMPSSKVISQCLSYFPLMGGAAGVSASWIGERRGGFGHLPRQERAHWLSLFVFSSRNSTTGPLHHLRPQGYLLTCPAISIVPRLPSNSKRIRLIQGHLLWPVQEAQDNLRLLFAAELCPGTPHAKHCP